ncbi:hypothetical protein J7E63_02015 [Bacillus sp. ISL-75]|uniref:hypothetical protein n=1 Tax=Bacillus sp. ISL-75 TaxID=2819137 RepID=UPI001BE8A5BC|nr:hypothetical protein [Bacillus sp. ISL-75]MBT2725712.1 hypothetical protein [Bacillus sp. ISL-75]
MKTVIIILVLFFLFISLLQLYINRKWQLVYTAFGHDQYFMIIAKLNAAGVKYKIKTPVNFHNDGGFKDQTQYDIFVKKDEEHRAHAALQNKY